MSAVSPRPRLGAAVGQLRELGPRVFLARWGVALAAMATALAITVRTHLYFIRPYAMPALNDEGTFAGVALRFSRGHWLPYVDGVAHDGPIPCWLAAVAMQLGGPFSWTPLRVLALALALGIEAAVFLLGIELFSPFAAGVAVLVQTYFFTFQVYPLNVLVHDAPLGNDSALAYGSELVGVQLALLSALLIARVQTRPASSRVLTIAAAGALAACAGLSKEGMLVHVVPALLWLVVGPIGSQSADARATPRRRAAAWADLASYLLGLAVPFAAVLVVYASAGHVRELVYYYERYGRDVFMAPLTSELVREKLREQIDKYLLGILGVSFLALFALARTTRALLRAPRDAGSWRARVRESAPSLFALLHLAAAVVGASLSWRFFPQYFVEVYPFLGLVAGHALCESFEGMDEHQLPKVLAGLVVVAGATVVLAITTHTLHENIVIGRESGQSYLPPQADPIVRYVAETTKASDALFVWGRHAEIYVSAQRQPGSRFVDTVYPAGVVPWFPASTAEEQELRVVPGSRELLLADLEESKPELIVDDGRTLDGRYMYMVPVLRDYLDREYCFVRHVDGEPIYRRRHGSECSPPDTVQ